MAGNGEPDRTYSGDGQAQWWQDPAVRDDRAGGVTPETFFTPGRPTSPPPTSQRPTSQRPTSQRPSSQPPGRRAGGGGRGPQGPGRPGTAAGRGGRRFVDYPRYGRNGFLRWIPSWRLVTSLALFMVTLLVVAFVVAYAATPVQVPDTSTLPQTSFVFYSDGTQIGQFKQESRQSVDLAEDPEDTSALKVPVHVQNAVLSAEDRTFYSNRGVSPTGILRALWNNVRGRPLQGGSTITQQYVKNFFTNGDRTVTRKAKEFLISLKVAQQVPKKDILKDYLNKIYFGRNAYGIQAAAVAYFGVDVGKLSVSQGAFLAGIIDGPELYDYAPDELTSPPALAAKARWQYVLDGMVSEAWLDAAAEQQVLAAGVPALKVRGTLDRTNQRGYLMDMIEKEFIKITALTGGDLRTGGYTIRTTFRKDLIDKAVASVSDVLGPRKTWPAGTQTGIASVDPKDGAILSIYGGDDTTAYNAATQAQVIAGSTFKPFALIAALEGNPDTGVAPLSLRSRFSGASPYTLKIKSAAGKKVTNFGKGNGEQFGMIDLIQATAESVNTVYAQLNERVGPKLTEETAIKAGLPAPPKTPNGPGTLGLDATALNVLGSAAPHVLDMASAYATIAAGGVYSPPFMITSITPPDGAAIYTHATKSSQVFNPDVIADTTYAMQQVIKRGTGTFARSLGRPAAGKTGTSSFNKSAWFVGFTPQLSTAVGLYKGNKNGGNDTLVGWGPFKGRELAGATFPVQLWTSVMKAALKGSEVKQLPEPVYGGDEVNPSPSAVPSPTPSPSDLPSPSSTGQPPPTDQPTPSPSGTDGQPTDTGNPSPPGPSGGPSPGPTVASASASGVVA